MVAARTDRRSRRAQARTRVRADRPWESHRLIGQTKSGQAATFAYDNNSNMTTKWHQGGSPQTMQHDAADRLTTMQIGGTTTTMQWGLRGVLARQYETGVIKATYGYLDLEESLPAKWQRTTLQPYSAPSARLGGFFSQWVFRGAFAELSAV